MPDLKISQLAAGTTPLAGTELVPIVQSGVTSRTTVQAIMTSTVPSGTANGVLYLNGSKVATTGTALTFDGTTLVAGAAAARIQVSPSTNTNNSLLQATNAGGSGYFGLDSSTGGLSGAAYALALWHNSNYPIVFGVNNAEQMRLTSTGLGIGTSSPSRKLDVQGAPVSVGGNATGVLANFVNNTTAFNASPTVAISLWNRYNSGGSTFPSAVVQAGKENATDGNFAGYLSLQTTDAGGTSTERMRLDSSGNLIQIAPTTPPTLSTNGAMVFNLTSNTNLRVSVRGSDGVTRVANLTLA